MAAEWRALVIDRRCEHCRLEKKVMIEMVGGAKHDTLPWLLCADCWYDGIRTVPAPTMVGINIQESAPSRDDAQQRLRWRRERPT